MSSCASARSDALRRSYSVKQVTVAAQSILKEQREPDPLARGAAVLFFPGLKSRPYAVFLTVYRAPRAAILAYRDFGPYFRKKGDVVVRLANVVIDASPPAIHVAPQATRAMSRTIRRIVARLSR